MTLRDIRKRATLDMRRRTFDLLASGAGLLIAIVLILAAALMTGAYTFVNNQVTTQLSEQKIFFAAAGSPALKALPPADQAAMTPVRGPSAWVSYRCHTASQCRIVP